MATIRSYGGPDIELEKALMPFYENTKYPLIPVETIAVTPKNYSQDELDGKSASEVLRDTKGDYVTLLERLKEKADTRAKALGICRLNDTYLTNIHFDEKTKVMSGDLFEPRCQNAMRGARSVKTYSGSVEKLREILQRQVRPLEHFAIVIEKNKNFAEALDELGKYAKAMIERLEAATTIYAANINFHPEAGIMTGDMLEVDEYSTACETIV